MSVRPQRCCASVLAASLMLPGLAALALPVQAESAPQQGVVAIKASHYSDSQPGWQRVTVRSPSVYMLAPLAGDWALEGTWAGDAVSGSTPRLHSFESGATPYMSDRRTAADLKVTRYFARTAVSAGAAYSDEYDYTSRALGLEARISSDDNNTTWAFGYGAAQDLIDNESGGGRAIGQHRRAREWMAGVTHILTPEDIVQISLTRSLGRGYFSDSYKDFDLRPDVRHISVALLRWNHHIDPLDTTLRASYRAYRDSFGIVSHTLGLEATRTWGRWTVTPGLRTYSQSAASFYFDPVTDANGVPSAVLTRRFANRITGYSSADTRLAAFGALSWSLKLDYAVDALTQVDVRFEGYRKSASLKWGGGASPYLQPLNARTVQLGVSRKFR